MTTGDKITLDKDTFKVLASETRVGILKKLDKSQMTVSDLARALDMSKATLFEHLEKLINVGLIKKKEDERKWVYYKLTWKGKNILHPERTKIAIALTVFVLAFVVISSFMIMTGGYNKLVSDELKSDAPVSDIELEQMDDLNENSISPNSIIIETNDNELEKSTIKIEYTIDKYYVENVELLTGWQELSGTIEGTKIKVQFPKINWSNNTGKYIYFRVTIEDEAGNYVQNVYIEYIEEIFDNTIDLSISKSDVVFLKNIDTLPRKGVKTIPIRIKVHNTGTFDVENVTVSVYSKNPDLDDDGFVNHSNNSIITKKIEIIQAGQMSIIEVDINLDLTYTNTFWVSIDPSNEVNESNETNNIISVNLKSFTKASRIPEFSSIVGFLLIILIIFLCNLVNKRALKKD